jgi:lipid A 3-O-deacylase
MPFHDVYKSTILRVKRRHQALRPAGYQRRGLCSVNTILRVFKTFALCAVLATPVSAAADDPDFLTVSVGAFDLVQDHDQAVEFRAEYRSDKKIWIFKPFIGAMGTTDSAFYGFGGVLVDVFFGKRWVLTPSLAAGYYDNGDGVDLGHEIEFRSSIELSYRFDNRTRLGLSFYHLSNASIGDTNPGTEVLSVVYSIPLGSGN